MLMLEDLGRRIRQTREKLGLKQNDIASAMQISPQAVSKWERGENGPDITLLTALAKLLGVTTDWLLGAFDHDQDVFQATAFVSGVHGAYGKSVGMSPRDYAAWTNGVFYQVTEAVARHDGVPIKYMGDEFLAFFSGQNHAQRAMKSAKLAVELIAESVNLRLGLSSGEIYLGNIGHPDYANNDIMGETVNLAFLTMMWADEHTDSGMCATHSVFEQCDPELFQPDALEANFGDYEESTLVYELQT